MKNKSEISVMLKEAGILFVITLLSGLLLGVVYEVTKEPIRLQQEKAVQEACKAVFPGSGDDISFEVVDAKVSSATVNDLAQNNVEIGTIYAATESGNFRGYVVESVSAKGYGGKIVLYVGVSADKTVGGVSILELKETAGLGMEAPNVLAPQFAGKRVESFVYTKTGAKEDNEVDAISSATITTKAVTNAVNGGLRVALELMEGGAVNE